MMSYSQSFGPDRNICHCRLFFKSVRLESIPKCGIFLIFVLKQNLDEL